MLWSSIFEFFVSKVFGGVLGDLGFISYYQGALGRFISDTSSGSTKMDTSNFIVSLGSYNIPLGNYLSFIATLISVVIILVLCCLFIGKIIRVVSRLFMGA